MKKTKKNYIEYLNELGIPEDDKKSNGGRIPDNANYGQWIYRNDPIAFNVGYNDIKNTILIDSSKVLLNLVMDEIKFDNELHLQFGIDNVISTIEEVCLQTSWNKENQEVDFRLDYNPDGMINYTLTFSLNLDDSYRGEYDFIPFDYEENNITKINFYDRWTLDDGLPTAEDLAEYGDIASHEEREIIERAMQKNDM